MKGGEKAKRGINENSVKKSSTYLLEDKIYNQSFKNEHLICLKTITELTVPDLHKIFFSN